ncbi:MAG: hypothetical protein N3C13_01745, partial [Aquificaceae bacterium]|nr:hypothetical protein [Aquificaceae bacterium]
GSEMCIRDRKKGVKVYNASDGLLIEGAIPTPLETLRLERTLHKEQVIKAVEENFHTRYLKVVRPTEHLQKLVLDFENLAERVKDYGKRFDFRKREEAVQSFTELVKDLIGLKNPLLYNLLYHNTHQWSQIALGQALSMEEGEREEFLRFFWELYRAFLKEATGQVKKLAEEFR